MAKELIARYFSIFYVLKDIFSGRKRLKDCFNSAPFDITFLALVIALLTIGIVMMFSASYINAWYDSDAEYDPYYYLKRQLVFAVLGIVAMLAVSFIKTDLFRSSSGTLMVIAVLLLIYVLINPVELEGKEQFKRWMEIPLIGTFQPSEIAKLALIMFMAFSMERNHKLIEKKASMLFPYAGLIVAVCGLVYLENHVSGTLLMLGIGAAMMFFGGIKWQWFAFAGGAVAVLAVVFVLNADKILEGYAFERIRIWLKLLTGEELTSAEATGSGWQSLQSLYAIGSGGLFGLGFGNSKQKHMYLPEPQNDFVFAVVCEELGFVRAFLIIILFVLLVARGFVIGLRAKSKFDALLAMGISFHVGLQAALNIAVVTATVPNTGISLPFFSYGGTSLVMLLIEMGIVLAISRNGERTKKNVK